LECTVAFSSGAVRETFGGRRRCRTAAVHYSAVMAFLQVLTLAFGTLFSLMQRINSLPSLLEDLKAGKSLVRSLQVLLACHLACLLWLVYSLQIWDADFAIPNIVLGVLTFGFAGLIHALGGTQGSASMKYALLVPVVMLVLWRAFPAPLTGLCAALLQLAEFVPVLDHVDQVRKAKEIDGKDKGQIGLGLLRCAAWGCFGLLKADYCIVAAFAAGFAAYSVDFAVSSKLEVKRLKQQ